MVSLRASTSINSKNAALIYLQLLFFHLRTKKNAWQTDLFTIIVFQQRAPSVTLTTLSNLIYSNKYGYIIYSYCMVVDVRSKRIQSFN